MTTFLEQVALATNKEFIHRVQQAAVKAALAIMAEADETPAHTERCALAQRVLHDPQAAARLLAYGMATATLSLESSDSDLEWMIASIWNAYAGA